MKITSFVKQNNIFFDIRANNRVDFVRDMSRLLGAPGAAAAVCERENKRCTGVANGVAFPRAICPTAETMVGGIAFAPHGIDWGLSRPRMVFFLTAPPRFGKQYMKAVVSITRLLNSAETINALKNCNSAAEVLKILDAFSAY